MKKRLLSLFMVLAVLSCMAAPVRSLAAEPVVGAQSGTVGNPLYDAVPEVGQNTPEDPEDGVSAARKAAVYVSPKQAADQLRQAMLERQTSVTLYINVTDYWATSGKVNWLTVDFFPMAYSQELAKGPYDGDYLQWSWSKFDWEMLSHSGTQYAFRVELQYYTTLQQEQELQRQLTRLAGQLGLTSKSPYEAYSAIYNYITANVRYDHTGLSAIHDGITGNEDYTIFTAYGALINGRAVCQGYTMLYYALCRYAGLPVRVITSVSHAWNIVQLKGVWYDLDPTWDADTATGRQWFLLGSDNFDGGMHTAAKEYRTAEFISGYPISRYDYDPDIPYADVSRSSVHYDDIRRATELKLFNGTSATAFSPGMDISRAMLVTVLWRREGSPVVSRSNSFQDVSRSAYYAQAVDWAAANGIVNGYSNTRFGPDDSATREQVVTILYRYASYLGKDMSPAADLGAYTDRGRVSDYALRAIQWSVSTGIVKGTSSTTLSPQGVTSREQMASLLIRLIDYYHLA